MKVLLIEDNSSCADFIVQGLRQSGFQVIHSEDGLFKARTKTYDVAVIDVMLLKLDGLAVIEEIRRAKIKTPIIVLSARDSVESKVQGIGNRRGRLFVQAIFLL
ncbi:MAG TPA: response regulator [Lentisphaeria bacterium]|nr:response regulator [Lentisphaeria bacterium]